MVHLLIYDLHCAAHAHNNTAESSSCALVEHSIGFILPIYLMAMKKLFGTGLLWVWSEYVKHGKDDVMRCLGWPAPSFVPSGYGRVFWVFSNITSDWSFMNDSIMASRKTFKGEFETFASRQ